MVYTKRVPSSVSSHPLLLHLCPPPSLCSGPTVYPVHLPFLLPPGSLTPGPGLQSAPQLSLPLLFASWNQRHLFREGSPQVSPSYIPLLCHLFVAVICFSSILCVHLLSVSSSRLTLSSGGQVLYLVYFANIPPRSQHMINPQICLEQINVHGKNLL